MTLQRASATGDRCFASIL